MSDFRDLFAEQEDASPVWFGMFAATADDLSDELPVIIPDFDVNLQWGPCRWQARTAVEMPQKGDPCLVIFDNRREPWVVAWWPY